MRWHVNCVPLEVEPVPALGKRTRHRGFMPTSTYSQGRQSCPSIMSPQTETHAFLICPHHFSRFVRQTQGHSPICTHAQTLAIAGKRRNEEVLEGAGLIRPLNLLIKQLHSILFWFQDLMNGIWKTSAHSFGQIMTCFFSVFYRFFVCWWRKRYEHHSID